MKVINVTRKFDRTNRGIVPSGTKIFEIQPIFGNGYFQLHTLNSSLVVAGLSCHSHHSSAQTLDPEAAYGELLCAFLSSSVLLGE